LNRDGSAGEFDKWLENLDGVEVAEASEPVPLDKTAPTS
jgi:hypothetical protein